MNFRFINQSPCLHCHICVLIFSHTEQRISGWKAFVLRTKDFPESQKGTFMFSDTAPNTWWQAAEIVRSVSVQQSVAFTVNTGYALLTFFRTPTASHTNRHVVDYVKIRAAVQSNVTMFGCFARGSSLDVAHREAQNREGLNELCPLVNRKKDFLCCSVVAG